MRVAGYSPAIAWAIACLCCAPPVPSRESIPGLPSSHLPQGACTSPGIANAIAFRLDRRLAGLSQSLGIRYTRYADDLLFSGDSSIAGRTERLATSVAAIALDEGFEVNYRKTRTMRRGNRQRALGLILNDRINTPRRDYETLKAILTNCVRHGPKSQNRAGHPRFRESLRGRISHIAGVHPGRGKKLSILFHQIDWA